MEENQAIRVVKEILEHSFSAPEGDGILSVVDLKSVVKISLDKGAGKGRIGCRGNVRSFLVIGE